MFAVALRVTRTIRASAFAEFVLWRPIKNIGRTASEICRDWLIQSSYEPIVGVPDVKLYDHRFCTVSDNSEMECRVAIRPKSAPKVGAS